MAVAKQIDLHRQHYKNNNDKNYEFTIRDTMVDLDCTSIIDVLTCDGRVNFFLQTMLFRMYLNTIDGKHIQNLIYLINLLCLHESISRVIVYLFVVIIIVTTVSFVYCCISLLCSNTVIICFFFPILSL